jgi:hypothetical protein
VPEFRGKKFIKDMFHGDRCYLLFFQDQTVFVYMVDRDSNILSSVRFARDSISCFDLHIPKLGVFGRHLVVFNIYGYFLACMEDEWPVAVGFEAEWALPTDKSRAFYFVDYRNHHTAVCLWTPLP